MTTLRDISEVHSQICAVIPKENIEFRRELEEYIDSLWYMAPELRIGPVAFIPYTIILNKYMPNSSLINSNSPSWQIQVRDIFSNVKTR